MAMAVSGWPPGVQAVAVQVGSRLNRCRAWTGEASVTLLAGSNPDIMLTLAPVGLPPSGGEEAPPVGEAFKIYITSSPSNAKLFIDGVYTHHLTPSDQKELKDVLTMLTPGSHVIRAERAGSVAEKTISVTSGDNGTIDLKLEPAGLPAGPTTKEALQKKISDLQAELAKLLEQLAKL